MLPNHSMGFYYFITKHDFINTFKLLPLFLLMLLYFKRVVSKFEAIYKSNICQNNNNRLAIEYK